MILGTVFQRYIRLLENQLQEAPLRLDLLPVIELSRQDYHVQDLRF